MNRIKLLREQKGISQQALAEMYNLSQQSIYKYENDLAEPCIQTLKDFADYFHTTVDYIVGYTDDPSRPHERIEMLYSPGQLQHLDRYCKLSPTLQDSVNTLVENILSEQKNS